MEELTSKVKDISWFHTFDFGNGLVTKGADNTSEKLKTIKMNDHVKGRTVLDVGAWDGFFSFEAEKRGASKIVAVDPFMWNGNQWGSKAGFNLAKQILNSHVHDIDLKDISEIDTLGTFDVVLFLGVLYHLKDPMVVLEKVAKVTGNMLILETELDTRDNRFPMMSFNYDKEVYADHTNYWFPNQKLVEELLKSFGFNSVKMVYKTDVIRRVGRAYLNRGRSKLSFSNRTKMVRAVFHAFK